MITWNYQIRHGWTLILIAKKAINLWHFKDLTEHFKFCKYLVHLKHYQSTFFLCEKTGVLPVTSNSQFLTQIFILFSISYGFSLVSPGDWLQEQDRSTE